MIVTIESAQRYASINTLGAELFAFGSKQPRQEYLWQGNPEVWSGRSPVLFPVIGRLLDDSYCYQGKAYKQDKHGFARKSEFRLAQQTADSASFTLESSPETQRDYPFDFILTLHYAIDDSGLTVTHTVDNRSRGSMYFSLGAHPGFQCEIGDYLEFEQAETVQTERIDADAYLLPERFPLLDNEKKLVITKDIFAPDAVILSGLCSKKVTLKSDNHTRELEFAFGDAPVLGLWAKPGASYVCIEPWFGINDSREKKADISEKREIVTLEEGKRFSYKWTATIK